ncbi:hypothetical protein [Flavobacterium wongokense]|uniref:hypothetical protein n=1 Tax=Flavobacterium wongokense TaxID=2910674 RepID=UPI001F217FC3|nr:hypothetical protein [Flavobacterium sp. WG47]MCF6132223.1 hypothetical protein [Flavobacterium sp. WG47]
MGKIITDKLFKAREGDLLFYPCNDMMIVRTISGFTSETLKQSPKYENCRQTANEFGRLSKQCKYFRLALTGILPKENNWAVANALTKKMREVLNCDTINERGERQLEKALASEDGRKQMTGYEFNPDVQTFIEHTLHEDSIQLNSKSINFPKGVNVVGFRLHRLAFDFDANANALTSTDWIIKNKADLMDVVVIDLPLQPDNSAILFTLLETQFYVYEKAGYQQLEDGSKSVRVVVVEKHGL